MKWAAIVKAALEILQRLEKWRAERARRKAGSMVIDPATRPPRPPMPPGGPGDEEPPR